MLKFLYFVVLTQLEFSYAPEVYENYNEALEVNLKDSDPVYACPAESESDIAKLQKLSKQHYELTYCLFDKSFDDGQDKLCQSEVRPIFVAYVDASTKKPIPCGSGKKRFLHYFGYYYCGGQDKLNKLLAIKKSDEVSHIPMRLYNVCFDVSKQKTIWTSHSIVKPSIFQDPSYKEQPYQEGEISTEPFFLKLKHILKTKQLYDAEKMKNVNSQLQILPQPMVPVEHFAKRIWKKVTNHYINMAPLARKMVTLMKAINEGLKTAALIVSLQERQGSESQKQELQIYTAVKGLHKPGLFLKFFKKDPTKIFEANIWYKFVYNEDTKQGIMIYIHNEPKKMGKRLCPPENEIYCYFTEWITSMKYFDAVMEIDLQYAYCCKVTSKETKAIFSKSFDIREVLDIHTLITEKQ